MYASEGNSARSADDRSSTSQLQNQVKDWAWRFWPTLPLYPYGRRQTLRREVVWNTIWTFDQIQGILYAVVPIRMTVVKLAAGGLLVYAPVAPTPECVRLMQELVSEHGNVKYIILPTSSGLEHKIFVGPFARQFPTAQVFVAPNQWSFPINLPLSWLGFPKQRTQVLPTDSCQLPFADEFDCAVLDIDLGRGSFAEVALLHRRSQTLLLTDAILSVSADPPAVMQLDPYPMLFHARESAFDRVEDTEANRRKGWQRISLFAVYFRPSALEPVNFKQTVLDAAKAPDRSRKNYFGLYPFRWKPNWQQSFEALRSGGRPFVAPILQTLIFPQAPQRVREWVEQVAGWQFSRIVSCHFDAPIAATPQQFRSAFAFVDTANSGQSYSEFSLALPDEDFRFIRELEAGLIKTRIARSPQQ